MKRPDKAIIEQAVRTAGGNVSRAAGLIGCSRSQFYTWVYQYGLADFVGIRKSGPDVEQRPDSVSDSGDEDQRTFRPHVRSSDSKRPILTLVASESVVPDVPQRASVELRTSVLLKAKHAALDQRCTVSALVERALVAYLDAEEAAPKKARKREDSK